MEEEVRAQKPEEDSVCHCWLEDGGNTSWRHGYLCPTDARDGLLPTDREPEAAPKLYRLWVTVLVDTLNLTM